jgi:peptide chain release factor 1
MLNRDVLLKALAAKARRHADVTELLQQPEVVSDMDQLRDLSREHGQLDPFSKVHDEVLSVQDELEGARELAAGDDAEMAELAEVEIAELEPRLEELWTRAEDLLAEDDELSGRDVILEIRAGVGGAEAALFAGDLFTMYQHFCQKNRLKMEVLDQNAGEMGGFKEITVEVRGSGAYRLLRFESGGHRVQRVPKTETQGRIHTSAATVAVLPKAEELDVGIDWEKDVREDKMRAGGPGGQKVNKTESAIRLTHLDTGITVHIQDEKSQHKNRAKARQILASRLLDHVRQKADAERAAQRKGMIGSGDRSQRIRTYNFPQNRVTDHRIEFSLHDLEGVLLGRLDDFRERLAASEREARLEMLAEELTREAGEA